jgi:hypothetical protein
MGMMGWCEPKFDACTDVTNLVEKIKYICGGVFLIYPLMAQRQSLCGIVVGTKYIEPLPPVCTLQLSGGVSWLKNSLRYGGYAYDSDFIMFIVPETMSATFSTRR